MVKYLFVAGLLLTLVTALTNIGFIAIDDYEYNVSLVVPAGKQDLQTIVTGVDMRSPIPSLFLNGIARLGAGLGIEKPTSQFRFVLVVLTLISFPAVFWAAQVILPGVMTALLLSFYFATPLLLSRSMFESLSIPYLMWSVAFACLYWRHPRLKFALFSVFFIALAGMFRFQVGVCGLAILVIAAARGERWHKSILLLLGGLLLFLTGLPDYYLKGEWHASLRSYTSYNAGNSSSYGITPFYTYALLFLGLSLPPTLFSRYRGMDWKAVYGPLIPAVVFFAIFFVSHSAVPHKEERFMIPMLPLFIVLVTPMFVFLRMQKWRVVYAAVLNLALLPLACFNEPQKNVIALVQYVDERPQVRKIVAIDDTLVLYPKAFMREPAELITQSSSEWSPAMVDSCDTLLAVRPDLLAKMAPLGNGLVLEREFEPGWLEGEMVKRNPKHNARRGKISLYRKKECT